MRFGVLSDIHGNLHALDTVLESLHREGVDALWCAGDLVGYGPFPNECVERVAQLGARCVAGNHDLIAIGKLSPQVTSELARSSLEWTHGILHDDARAYLESLPNQLIEDEIVLSHGTLGDPSAYVWTGEEAQAELDRLGAAHPRASTLVLGHTHIASLFRDGDRRMTKPESHAELVWSSRVLINPGSVGQSRELHPWARFAVLNTNETRVSFHCVDYDVDGCRRELVRRGRPASSCHMRPSSAQRAWDALRRLGARR